MITQQSLNMAKRAREAHRRVHEDFERHGQQSMADKAVAKIDDMKLKHLAAGEKEPFEENKAIVSLGGIPIEKDELINHGLDPAVLYILNDEESMEPLGTYYSFDDGSLAFVNNKES